MPRKPSEIEWKKTEPTVLEAILARNIDYSSLQDTSSVIELVLSRSQGQITLEELLHDTTISELFEYLEAALKSSRAARHQDNTRLDKMWGS